MMELLLSKVLPPLFLIIFAVWQFRRAQRGKVLRAYNYWYLGMAGYGLFTPWVHGLLWDGTEALWGICMVGCVASTFLECVKITATMKALDEIDADLERILQIVEEADVSSL